MHVDKNTLIVTTSVSGNKFAEEFEGMMKALRKFIEVSQAHSPFLLRKARRIEEYLDQNERFSQIRYGSQVDLIIPLDGSTGFELLLEEGNHVEAGVDPLLKIKRPFE